jgi:hypothetical protein
MNELVQARPPPRRGEESPQRAVHAFGRSHESRATARAEQHGRVPDGADGVHEGGTGFAQPTQDGSSR